MEVTFVNKRTGRDFIKELEIIYGSMDNLKELIKKDPEHPLYTLDLKDWMHLMDNPKDLVETNELILIDDFEFELPEIHIIEEKNPLIALNFTDVDKNDLLETQLAFQIKSGEAMVKFEKGSNTAKPVVSFKNIELQIGN